MLLGLLALNAAASFAATKITIAVHFEAGQIEYLEPYVQEYQRLHPEVEIELLSTPFAEFLPKLQVMQASGVGPDIVHVYSLWAPQLRDLQLVSPAPAPVARDIEEHYVSTAVQGVTLDGEILGYPTEINNYMLLYNKRLFAERGLAGPPLLWDEMIETAKRLTDRDPAGTITQAGFAFLRGWDSAVVHPFLALLFSEGGRLFSADQREVLLHSPEALTTLERQVRMFEEGATDPAVDLWGGFPGERVAMVVMAPWWESSLKSTMGDRFEVVGVAPIPGGREGNKSLLYTWFWSVNDRSPHKDQAWAFLQWLNGPRQSGETSRMGDFLVTLGIIPSRWIDIENHPEEFHDDFTRPFVEHLEASLPEPVVPRGQEIKEIMWQEIEAAWFGQKPPRAALGRKAAHRRDSWQRRMPHKTN